MTSETLGAGLVSAAQLAETAALPPGPTTLALYTPSVACMVSMWYAPPVVDLPSPCRRFHCLEGSQRPEVTWETSMSLR